MKKDKIYVFSFKVINPNLNQAEGDVIISSSCFAGSRAVVAARPMRVPNETIKGIVHGSNPLLVVIPTFKRSMMSQSDPLVGRGNVISLTLMSNVDLRASENSAITLSGFQNVRNLMSKLWIYDNLPVILLPTADGNEGHLVVNADFVVNSFVFKLAPGKTLEAEQVYKLQFALMNPTVKQERPQIRINAAGTALFEIEPMAVPHLTLVGVLNGSDPMLIEAPEFKVKHIAQSMPLAFYKNIFTVTIQTNVNLAHSNLCNNRGRCDDGSFIKMTGLQYAIGPPSIQLTGPNCWDSQGKSLDPSGYCPNGNQGHLLFSNDSNVPSTATFINGTITLYLHSNKTMQAHIPYIITFELQNPDSRLDGKTGFAASAVGTVDGAKAFVPPAKMFISADGTATIIETLMIYPNMPLLGLEYGTNPMVLMLEPSWYKTEISQSNPLASEANVITIYFSTNVQLRGLDRGMCLHTCTSFFHTRKTEAILFSQYFICCTRTFFFPT
jgi:hypothetical protein